MKPYSEHKELKINGYYEFMGRKVQILSIKRCDDIEYEITVRYHTGYDSQLYILIGTDYNDWKEITYEEFSNKKIVVGGYYKYKSDNVKIIDIQSYASDTKNEYVTIQYLNQHTTRETVPISTNYSEWQDISREDFEKPRSVFQEYGKVKLEIGKFYQHKDNTMVSIRGVLSTLMYGNVLVGEDTDGRLQILLGDDVEDMWEISKEKFLAEVEVLESKE